MVCNCVKPSATARISTTCPIIAGSTSEDTLDTASAAMEIDKSFDSGLARDINLEETVRRNKCKLQTGVPLQVSPSRSIC